LGAVGWVMMVVPPWDRFYIGFNLSEFF